MVSAVSRIRIGATDDEKTELGPLISSAQRSRVEALVDGRSRGARLLAGGKRADLPGFYFEPSSPCSASKWPGGVGLDPESRAGAPVRQLAQRGQRMGQRSHTVLPRRSSRRVRRLRLRQGKRCARRRGTDPPQASVSEIELTCRQAPLAGGGSWNNAPTFSPRPTSSASPSANSLRPQRNANAGPISTTPGRWRYESGAYGFRACAAIACVSISDHTRAILPEANR
jgi:hypothetical protein